MYFIITLITLFFLGLVLYILQKDDKQLAMHLLKLLIVLTVVKIAYMLYHANKGESYCKTIMRMAGCA
jgi:hypothetical protein